MRLTAATKIWEKYWAVLIRTFNFFPWVDISLEWPYREFCHYTSANTNNSPQRWWNWDFIVRATWMLIGVAGTKMATVFLCFLLLTCQSSVDTYLLDIDNFSIKLAVCCCGYWLRYNQSLNLDSVSQAAWKRHSFDISAVSIENRFDKQNRTKWKFQLNHIRKGKSFLCW